LQANKGESIVILGGSGSGKSVLIKIIASLLTPSSGSVKIGDMEVANIGARDRDKLMEKFGFLFQGGALFDSIPIWENVAFRLINQKKIDKENTKIPNLVSSKETKPLIYEHRTRIGEQALQVTQTRICFVDNFKECKV
jgi:ABC-type transporter Mla maintaining outer membrane lipid asymmetry ATPase subunit MlaF